ncbi:MAG: alpha/beta hydrolase [Desulfurivibrio sp.]|nr:alpha/beta hydrolase [Desulfurivibrio sp.]MBU4033730.1 alpha/beta hydrolase [Pseudomonadota bacterium]
MLASLLTIIALAYLGFCLILFFMQDRFLYYPLARIEATPAAIGLPFSTVTLVTTDNLALSAWFVPAEKPKGAILFCHGNGGNISHRLDSLRIFHALGYSTLIFDYRGYGESEGFPNEAGTYLDARAAWRHLTDNLGFAPQEIVLFGRSLGAAVAADLATEVTPAGLIVESAFTSAPDLAAELFPLLPARLLCKYRYDTLRSLAKISCPLLVVHSPDDEIIPFAHGKKLYAAAHAPKQFLEIRGDHNSGFLVSESMYRGTLDVFLQKTERKPLYLKQLPETSP